MNAFEWLIASGKYTNIGAGKTFHVRIEDVEQYAKYYHEKEVKNTLNLPDIRNKLTPISNLIAMLESSELMYHHETEVHKIIEREIEQCKKSIEYLSKKDKEN